MEDKFTIYKNNVKDIFRIYKNFVKDNQDVLEDKGLYKSIERQAQPFIDGYFTLAVMGNTSAGKSTFINALLGNVGLLPTDFRQTTCVLTEIFYGEKLSIDITYGDGNTKQLYDPAQLRELVAIPEEYANYPINTLNDFIMKGYDEREVLKRRNILIQDQGGMKLDDDVIKKYVATHNPSNIPLKVVIKYPLPEIYRGWKIVDTPGVNAIGGIEDRTKSFIDSRDSEGNSIVDAIIFIKSGKESISDSGFNNFVRQTFNSLTENAKKRLFMLLSFAASNEFMTNKDYIMNSAINLFGQYGISKERVISVDSICELFLTSAQKNNWDIQNLNLQSSHLGWDKKTWTVCIQTLMQIKIMLMMKGENPNNQILEKLVTEISGFGELRNQLNEFIKSEKIKAYRKFTEDVLNEMARVANIKKKDSNNLKSQIDGESSSLKYSLDKSKKIMEETEANLNNDMRLIREKYNKAYIDKYFKTYEVQCQDTQYYSDTVYMKNKATRLIQEIQDASTELFKQLSEEFSSKVNCDNASFSFAPIDFDTILQNANENNKKQVGYYTKEEKSKKCCSSGYNYYTVTDYNRPKYEIEKDKARTEFFNKVYAKFQNHLDLYKKDIYNNIQKVGDEARKALSEALEAENTRQAILLEKYKDVESKNKQIAKLESEYNTIVDYIKTINSKKQ